jgi:hypothetical protein
MVHEPAELLREIKKSMGSMLFSAQYQQTPEPAGGKIIKRKMLRYHSELETLPAGRLVLSWDRRGRHRLFSKRHSDWGVSR